MRLINADKFEVIEFKNKSDDFCDGAMAVLEMIDNAPTVCDIEVLKKEIEQNAMRYSLAKESGGLGQVEWSEYLIPIDTVLKIIDSYFSKGEDKC